MITCSGADQKPLCPYWANIFVRGAVVEQPVIVKCCCPLLNLVDCFDLDVGANSFGSDDVVMQGFEYVAVPVKFFRSIWHCRQYGIVFHILESFQCRIHRKNFGQQVCYLFRYVYVKSIESGLFFRLFQSQVEIFKKAVHFCPFVADSMLKYTRECNLLSKSGMPKNDPLG
jgi:hypothetical protein